MYIYILYIYIIYIIYIYYIYIYIIYIIYILYILYICIYIYILYIIYIYQWDGTSYIHQIYGEACLSGVFKTQLVLTETSFVDFLFLEGYWVRRCQICCIWFGDLLKNFYFSKILLLVLCVCFHFFIGDH